MEDSRLSISFATESIQFTLHHAVKSNLLDELDIQNGILQLIRAIQFIHTANIIHTNINLNSIYINRNGDWKISGLGFSQSCVGQTTSVSLEFLKHYPPFCSPILDFISPEYVFEEYICFSSDVYSLGLLISALYNSGASPLNCNENLHLYKQLASSRLDFGKVPNGLYQLVERMVQRDPKYRIGLNELSESSYFNNILVGTIKFLDSFVEKTQIEKVFLFNQGSVFKRAR